MDNDVSASDTHRGQRPTETAAVARGGDHGVSALLDVQR